MNMNSVQQSHPFAPQAPPVPNPVPPPLVPQGQPISVPMGQPQPPIIVYQAMPKQPFRMRCRGALLVVSSLLAIFSALILILGISGLSISASGWYEYGPPAGFEGSAIWGGIFLVITAAIGLAGVWKANKCMLVAYLVLSILAASLFGLTVFAMATTWAGISGAHRDYRRYGSSEYLSDKIYEKLVGIYGTIAFFSLSYVVLAVVASGILCGNLCPCCKRKEQILAHVPTDGTVIYSPNTATTQSIIAQVQQGATAPPPPEANMEVLQSGPSASHGPPSYDETMDVTKPPIV